MKLLSRRTLPRFLASALLLGLVPNLTCLAIAEQPTLTQADVVYGHKDGLAMTMDVFRPESKANAAAILFLVSGGWFSNWEPPDEVRDEFAPYLDRGYTVFAVRHGSSPRYEIKEAVSDVRRSVRFIRIHAEQWGIDNNRLGALGMSAGGHLALMLGTTGEDADDAGDDDAGDDDTGDDEVERASSRVAAVVALVPPTDLKVAVWGAPESKPEYREFPALNISIDEAEQQSPVSHVTTDDAPALVVMGGSDTLVPPRHGHWIAEAFKKNSVKHRLIVIEGVGHGLGSERHWERVQREALAWFNDHLITSKEYLK